jgi:hypothetical protein
VDELDQRLKIDEVYSLIYRDNVESIEAACGHAGISKATFYNWPSELRDKIRIEVIQREMQNRREREETVDRAKVDLEMELYRDAVDWLRQGTARLGNILMNSRSDFNSIAAYKELRDTVRNRLRPDKAKTVIFEGKEEGPPLPQLPAPEPTRWLPPPDSVTHSDDLRLASEIQTKAKFPDGSQLETKLTRPDVVDG